MLDAIWKYRHLVDPTATARFTGKADSAPSGKWALSSDPKVNMALWNALGVTAAAVPTTAALTILANKYWDRKVKKLITERSLSKINAMRPQMSPNDDLGYTYNITNKPKKELMQILEDSDNLTKSASAEEGDGVVSRTIKNTAAVALPMVAAPVATYLTIRAVQNAHKKRLRKRLREERTAIRNMQDRVDHQILEEQGVIKSASMTADEAKHIWDRHGKDKDKEPLAYTALTFPAAVALGVSALGGTVAYKVLTDSDKYKNRLKYMRDHILGANTLQEAPKISLAKFKQPGEGMVARPGDKVAALIEEADKPVVIDVDPIEEAKKLTERTGLEEVTTTDLTPSKRSDALF